MGSIVSVAIVRDDPPRVFIAADQETLNWVLALRLIATTPGTQLEPGLRSNLRTALQEERWGDAVFTWIQANDIEVDVYPSESFYEASDVEMGEHELQFTPLFQD